MVQFSGYPMPYSPLRELDLILDTLLNVVIVQRNEGLLPFPNTVIVCILMT